MTLSWILLAEGGGGGIITLEVIVRLINLLIFVGIMYYLLRKPLGEALRARREGIRRELMRAQEERNAALAKLEEVEARLSRLDEEVSSVREQSQREAAEERERIRRSTE